MSRETPSLTAYTDGVSSVGAGNLNTFAQTCDTVAELRGFIGLPNIQVFIRGTDAPNDGGAGAFWWDASATGPDNGQTVIVPTGAALGAWIRLTTTGTAQVEAYAFATTTQLLAAFAPAVALTNGTIAVTSGRTVVGDGGGGVFHYASGSVAAENHGTIRVDSASRRWIYQGSRPSWELFGADNTGVADSGPALTYGWAAGYTLQVGPGTFTVNTDPGTSPFGVGLIGSGYADGFSGTAKTVIKMNFAGGFVFGDNNTLDLLTITAGTSASGNNVNWIGTRGNIGTISVLNAKQDNFRVGKDTGTGTWNANLGTAVMLICVAAARHNVFFDDTSASVPLEANAGSWSILNLICQDAGGDNLKGGQSIQNVIVNFSGQGTTAVTGGFGFNLTSKCWGWKIGVTDIEGCAAGSMNIAAGALQNWIEINQPIAGQIDIIDNEPSTLITYSDARLVALGGCGYAISGSNINLLQPTGGQKNTINMVDNQGALSVRITSETQDTSGGKLTISTRKNGGAVTDALVIDDLQNVTMVQNSILAGSATGPCIKWGTGSPEGAVTAPVGSLWIRTNGTAGTLTYQKQTGTGNTGWVAVL